MCCNCLQLWVPADREHARSARRCPMGQAQPAQPARARPWLPREVCFSPKSMHPGDEGSHAVQSSTLDILLTSIIYASK